MVFYSSNPHRQCRQKLEDTLSFSDTSHATHSDLGCYGALSITFHWVFLSSGNSTLLGDQCHQGAPVPRGLYLNSKGVGVVGLRRLTTAQMQGSKGFPAEKCTAVRWLVLSIPIGSGFDIAANLIRFGLTASRISVIVVWSGLQLELGLYLSTNDPFI